MIEAVLALVVIALSGILLGLALRGR